MPPNKRFFKHKAGAEEGGGQIEVESKEKAATDEEISSQPAVT